ncbi:MAG: hypothetical protein IJW58_02675 [Clostridia bacterium]|nr:hypothetical protein [Clostridia bacterium]
MDMNSLLVFTLLTEIVMILFSVIVIAIAAVALIAIILVGLACEILLLPVTIIDLIVTFLGTTGMGWWSSIATWFIGAGESIVTFVQSLINMIG